VLIAHFLLLQSYISKKEAVSKPKTKVHHITLSSVVVKKPLVLPPKPKVEPIILPPDPEPIILPPDPDPIVKPKRVKKKKKKRRKKKAKKRKIIKPKPEPIIEQEIITEPVIQEPQQIVQQQVIAPVEKIDTSSIKDAYTSEIRRQIKKHLFYPKMAKRLRMQGEVNVSFRVLKDGAITNIRVINAPKKLLAKGAIKTLNMLNLRPIPDVLGESFLDITIPIEFKLIRR
jgi:protein TonB